MTLKLIARSLCVLSGMFILAGCVFGFFYGFNSEIGEYLLGAGITALIGGFTGFLLEFRRDFYLRQTSGS